MMNASPLVKEFLEKGKSVSCPIIDMHGHYGPFSWVYMPDSDAERMIKAMDRAGVRLTVCSSHYGLMVDTQAGNRTIREVAQHYPGRFLGYWIVNPNDPELIERDLKVFEREEFFVGFKLWPDYHQFPVTADPYVPVLEYANARKLSVLIHTWGYSPYDGPILIEKIAKKYPKATLIMGHSGYGEWDVSIRLAREYENVFLELTAVYATHDGIVLKWCPDKNFGIGVNGIIERMVRESGSTKILFGTDSPWYSAHYAAGAVLYSEITDEDIHNIFHRNAEKLLRQVGAGA
jgi:predicted TIM-barrel fold metal-dependent hydrolase